MSKPARAYPYAKRVLIYLMSRTCRNRRWLPPRQTRVWTYETQAAYSTLGATHKLGGFPKPRIWGCYGRSCRNRRWLPPRQTRASTYEAWIETTGEHPTRRSLSSTGSSGWGTNTCPDSGRSKTTVFSIQVDQYIFYPRNVRYRLPPAANQLHYATG
jgi:hypothetical protein